LILFSMSFGLLRPPRRGRKFILPDEHLNVNHFYIIF